MPSLIVIGARLLASGPSARVTGYVTPYCGRRVARRQADAHRSAACPPFRGLSPFHPSLSPSRLGFRGHGAAVLPEVTRRGQWTYAPGRRLSPCTFNPQGARSVRPETAIHRCRHRGRSGLLDPPEPACRPLRTGPSVSNGAMSQGRRPHNIELSCADGRPQGMRYPPVWRRSTASSQRPPRPPASARMSG